QYRAVLDLGCGLGFASLIFKLYLNNVEYLIGLDISREKLLKAKQVNLYDELIVADARMPPFRDKVFNLVISIEVIHGLPASILDSIEALSEDSIVLALPTLPEDASIGHLLKKGYRCYRYLLRGFILISLNDCKILLASDSKFFKIVRILLRLLKPILKSISLLERGYILAFK
ncbi:MAG: class I SAM-dependent methyltransferase, partial [Candidatus Bathyarchaeota archaeon]|nr:class I SAM-dependent methyltransferase [Candidatus Bathyarchaeota archaeon]